MQVIECNLRASRSTPFSSKVTGVNFVQLATQVKPGMDELLPWAITTNHGMLTTKRERITLKHELPLAGDDRR